MPEPDGHRECGNCLWWDEHDAGVVSVDGGEGYCRFCPPTHLDPDTGRARWPLTLAGDWCREHTNDGLDDDGHAPE